MSGKQVDLDYDAARVVVRGAFGDQLDAICEMLDGAGYEIELAVGPEHDKNLGIIETKIADVGELNQPSVEDLREAVLKAFGSEGLTIYFESEVFKRVR